MYPKHPTLSPSHSGKSPRSHEQLKQMIISKLKSRHGPSLKAGGFTDVYLSQEVNKLFAQGNLNQAKLANLEKSISGAIKSKAQEKKELPNAQAQTKNDEVKCSEKSTNPIENETQQSQGSWGTLITYDKMMYDEEQNKAAMKRNIMMQNLKKDLENQIEEKKKIKENNKTMEGT